MANQIRPIHADGLEEALALVNETFLEFVLPLYPAQGQATFLQSVSQKYGEILGELERGERRMIGCFSSAGHLMGVGAMRDPAHICMLFVGKAYQRQGVGRALFLAMLEDVKRRHAQQDAITVDASPYAVDIYRRMGFVEMSEQQHSNGILYTPMRYTITENNDPIPRL